MTTQEQPRTWPHITPEGFVYETPTTYDELRDIHATAAQAVIESWDPAEHPPAPTWELVGLAHPVIDELRRLLARALATGEHAVQDLGNAAALVSAQQVADWRVHVRDHTDGRWYAVVCPPGTSPPSYGNDPWFGVRTYRSPWRAAKRGLRDVRRQAGGRPDRVHVEFDTLDDRVDRALRSFSRQETP